MTSVSSLKSVNPESALLILIAPRTKFTTTEFGALDRYLENGGSILYLSHESGDTLLGTNFNYFLEERGMMLNEDCVIRTAFSKYRHPKEALISNGVLNREITRAAGKRHVDDSNSISSLSFVYPFGATMEVQLPNATPILGSGVNCLPVSRPIGAVHDNGTGRLCVLGSSLMFSDKYINDEENGKLFDVLVSWCLTAFPLNSIDASEPEIADHYNYPNIPRMSQELKCCLQESDELPPSGPALFAAATRGAPPSLFGFNTSLLPKALKLYEDLGLPYEPLSLISPQMETPLPALEPATFQPRLTELPGPQLELFDLDDAFASERTKLAMVTNKCNDKDLEYYIRESASILGITSNGAFAGREDSPSAKEILTHVFSQIVQWKKK